ncbi:hypothetical protein [Methylobacterium sp. W2]|nr:hypothetical protein [Methylobacterium sp. W2]
MRGPSVPGVAYDVVAGSNATRASRSSAEGVPWGSVRGASLLSAA